MITDRTTTNTTYQWRLRALGAFLDAQPAADVSILEIGSRFAVRYYDAIRAEASPVFVHIDDSRIQRIMAALESRRQARPPSSDAPLSVSSPREDRYQDLFRALGWELDDLEVSQVVIDERTDGLYVSYKYTGLDGVLVRKRTANLGVPEWETILHDARKRRGASYTV